jgi:hypothetical protein
MLIIAVVLFVCAADSFAQEEAVATKVTVRAVSRDAKVLGDKVGGVKITIRDVQTGKVLAEGIQKGGTGDTKLIMIEPRKRGAKIFDTEGTAGFTATLMLERPTQVEIIADGPLGFPQARQKVSKTLLLVPGQDILGDGIILEIHGFIVNILSPNKTERIVTGAPFEIRATVNLTCSCPTEPNGIWDANKIKITARLLKNGKIVQEIPLEYAGQSSTYTGKLSHDAAGNFEIEVLASDASNINFGIVKQQIAISRKQ